MIIELNPLFVKFGRLLYLKSHINEIFNLFIVNTSLFFINIDTIRHFNLVDAFVIIFGGRVKK